MSMSCAASVLPDLFIRVRIASAQDSVVPGAAITVAAGTSCEDKSGPRRKRRTDLSSNDPERLHLKLTRSRSAARTRKLGDQIIAHLLWADLQNQPSRVH
jgi:hypothetical protein